MREKSLFVISESTKELQKLYYNQKRVHLQKRVKALLRILNNDDNSRQDLSNYLGVHLRTLERWMNRYKEGGLDGLLNDSPRREGSKIITSEIHKGLSKRVNDPHKSFLGYWDAQQWVKSEYNVDINYHTLRKYLIQHFGTKVKSPRKSHIKKDEKAVAFFKNAE